MSNTDRYNYAYDPDSEAWAARLLRQVPAGCTVLELGPGPGAMTRVLVERGHAVTVVEDDPSALVVLNDLGVEVISGDLNSSAWLDQLGSRKFGAVLACDVLEHLHAPEAVLNALTPLMEPAAPLIISVPNIAYAGAVAALRQGLFDYADKGILDRTHMRFFTRRSMDKSLLEHGWASHHWEANRVPIHHSEFVWAWQSFGENQRQSLVSGWTDYDVYQWMVVATPMSDTAELALKLASAESEDARGKLHELSVRYEQEHASLLDHQKAFAEARVAIADLQHEMAELRRERDTDKAALQAQQRQLDDRAHQMDILTAQLSGLRAQGWPGRVRRAFDALRE